MADHLIEGVPIHFSDPQFDYAGLSAIKPTWPSAQGSVYLCHEVSGARQIVVIKKYLIVYSKDSETVVMPKELVETEIDTMAKCQHSNILRLLSVHIYEGYVFLITPYYDGGTLQEYCSVNRVSLSQMVFILKGLVSGLSEIHRHGYIHRDIKCENVFLGKDNTIMKRKIFEQGRPPYPENLNSQLEDFMNLCFKRDPEQRASTSELLESLFPPQPWELSSLAEGLNVNIPQMSPPQPANTSQMHSSQPKTLNAKRSQMASPEPKEPTATISQIFSPHPPHAASHSIPLITITDIDGTTTSFEEAPISDVDACCKSVERALDTSTSEGLNSRNVSTDKQAPVLVFEPNPNFELWFGDPS
ncbi:kinase-like domain-containing protein, partial [Jimgerdemannia flammicorona]